MPVRLAVATAVFRSYTWVAFLVRTLDALCVVACLWLVAGAFGSWTFESTLAGVFAGVLFVTIAEQKGLYRSWRGASLKQEVGGVFVAWFVASAVTVFGAIAIEHPMIRERALLLPWLLLSPVVLVVWRFVVRQGLVSLRLVGFNTRTAAIFGANKLGLGLERALRNAPWMGLRFRGFYDDNQDEASGIKVVGGLHEMVERARAGKIEIIYIALPMRAEEKIQEVATELTDTCAQVYVLPDLLIHSLLDAQYMTVAGIPMVNINASPFDSVGGMVKRLEDLVLGSVFLALAAIPMLAVAAAIRLTSNGPVIFKQRRYGLYGQVVRVWKFRTMTVCEDHDTPMVQARRGDVRVTRLGAFLRRTSLDELPQLINVLRGELSIVGPRPHPVALNEEYRKRIIGYMLRHKAKPGMTGWAQVNGWRGETDTVEKMKSRIEHDLNYIRNWSLWLDLRIIWRTLLVFWRDRNAY
jgi:putative colanic acid biosysnthesis UDP-glucose lipid carrier transferase